MSSSGYSVERGERSVRLRLDAPPLNVLDLELIAQLAAAVDELADDESLACLVVRGSTNAFSAGVSVADHTHDRIAAMLDRFHGLLARIERFPAPVLAAIEGHCLGGGMELAMACDLRVCSDQARFAQPEIRLACYPPWAAARYTEELGRAATADLILTGRSIGADEALRMGVVSRVFPAAGFNSDLNALLAEILAASTPVLRLAKKAMGRGGEERTALAEAERIYREELTRLKDLDEGLVAFTEKRPPTWKHR